MVEKAKVSVILCTYHPGRFLKAQLESIACQTLPCAELLISDDSSDASARQLIDDYVASIGIVEARFIEGPRKGFAVNFLTALAAANETADLFAFSDQDDVWLSDKLSTAAGALAKLPAGAPAVYCGRTQLIDGGGKPIGLSAKMSRQPSFCNAMVQSLAGGNTMVLNRAARNLVLKAGVFDVVSHDWWIYMLVTGVGGHVIFDSEPKLLYRQHEQNVIGANTSLKGRLSRLTMLSRDRYKDWNAKNARALDESRHLLLPENKARFDAFCKARAAPLLPRLIYLRKSGVHRQTRLGSLGLIFATLIGKI